MLTTAGLCHPVAASTAARPNWAHLPAHTARKDEHVGGTRTSVLGRAARLRRHVVRHAHARRVAGVRAGAASGLALPKTRALPRARRFAEGQSQARFILPVAKKISDVTDKRVYRIYRKISRSKIKQKIPNFSRKLYKLSLKHLILRTST
jgi:hypothetical protein